MPGPATQLLHRAQRGDGGARDALYALLYQELRARAVAQLRGERSGHTLTPTALVHETYLALVGKEAAWEGQAHLLGVASKAMRQLLVDHARRRQAGKRGGGAVHLPLDEAAEAVAASLSHAGASGAALLDLDRALDDLAERDARLGEVVECRVFGGLTVPETAAALALSAATVDRSWAKARAYLRTALAEPAPAKAGGAAR